MPVKTAEEMIAILPEHGISIVSVQELARRIEALGYRLDRRMDCRASATYLTGPLAGVSYPCCTTGIVEADTGRSFAHFESRRDANFRALQVLRGTVAAVSRGAILEL